MDGMRGKSVQSDKTKKVERRVTIPVSIAILTKDEEKNLPACLESLYWCNDIHIIDSGSTDKTVNIAHKKNLLCEYHPFESFGKQRNWVVDNIKFKYEWVLFLDADERSTDEFKDALLAALAKANDSIAGFYCCSKMILDNRWLKRSAAFPNWQFRLLRLGRARFIDYGHGQKEYQIKGGIGYIKKPHLHYPFNKGWSQWWERHNKYAEEEALTRLCYKIGWKEMFSKNKSIRNKVLKPFVSRIPGWPAIRFCIDYLLRLGFLEGREGFIYCFNMASYERLIRTKIQQLRKIKKRTVATFM